MWDTISIHTSQYISVLAACCWAWSLHLSVVCMPRRRLHWKTNSFASSCHLEISSQGWEITATLPFNTGTPSYLALCRPCGGCHSLGLHTVQTTLFPWCHSSYVDVTFQNFFHTISETGDEFDLGRSVSRFLTREKSWCALLGCTWRFF